jgi:putative membrane protein
MAPSKRGLHRSRRSAIIVSSRLPALILIAAPFSSRLSRYNRAHAEALRQFAAHGLHKTERRTGVLIFVSAAERYAEIVADAGIDRKVEQGAWDGAIGALIGAIEDGRAADGFVAAIEQCTRVLAVRFPPGALDRNELPNAIVEL